MEHSRTSASRSLVEDELVPTTRRISFHHRPYAQSDQRPAPAPAPAPPLSEEGLSSASARSELVLVAQQPNSLSELLDQESEAGGEDNSRPTRLLELRHSSEEEELDALPTKEESAGMMPVVGGLWECPLEPFQEQSATQWRRVLAGGCVPSARSSFAAQKYNSVFVFVHGGHDKEADLTDTFTLELGEHEHLWRKVQKATEQIKLPLVGHSAVALSRGEGSPEYILMFGGWDGKNYSSHGFLVETSHFEIQETSEWKPQQTKPVGRRDHSLVRDSQGQAVYLFGGWDPMRWNNTDFDFNQLWTLQPDWAWQRVETYGPQPLSRRGHSCLAHDRQLLLFAGLYGYSRYLSDLCALSLATRTWREVKPALDEFWPRPQAWHSAEVLKSAATPAAMYVFGGMLENGTFSSDFLRLDLSLMVWKVLVVQGQSPEARCSHACVKVGERALLVFGGLSQEENSQEFNGLSYMMSAEQAQAPDPYRVQSLDELWVFETGRPLGLTHCRTGSLCGRGEAEPGRGSEQGGGLALRRGHHREPVRAPSAAFGAARLHRGHPSQDLLAAELPAQREEHGLQRAACQTQRKA